MKKFLNRNTALVYLFTLVVCFIGSFYIKESDVDMRVRLSGYHGIVKMYYSYGDEFSEDNAVLIPEERQGEDSVYTIDFSTLRDGVDRPDDALLQTKILSVRIDFESYDEELENIQIVEHQFRKGVYKKNFFIEHSNDLKVDLSDNGITNISFIGADPYILDDLGEIYNKYSLVRAVLVYVGTSLLFCVGMSFYILIKMKKNSMKICKAAGVIVISFLFVVLSLKMQSDKQLTVSTNGYFGTLKIYLNENGYSEDNTFLSKKVSDTMCIRYGLELNEKVFNLTIPDTKEYRLDFESFGETVSFIIDDISYDTSIMKNKILPVYFKEFIVGTNDLEMKWVENKLKIRITGTDPFLVIQNDYMLSKIHVWNTIENILGFCVFLVIMAGWIFIPEQKLKNIAGIILHDIEWLKKYSKEYLQEISFLLLSIGVLVFGKQFHFIFNYIHLKISIKNQILLLIVILFAFTLIMRKYGKFINSNYICGKAGIGRTYKIITGVIVLLVLAGVYTFRLGIDDFHNDEHYHVLAAIGYLKTGHFIQWDMVNDVPWETYTRSWPYTWLIAQFFKIFGISEVSARLVSVVCGLVFAALFYWMVNKLTDNTYFSAVCTLLLGIHPNLIDIFRTVRMYSLMMVCGLLLIIFIFKAIYCRNKFKVKNKVTNWIENNFNFHFGYMVLSLYMLVINYLVMPNPLIIFLGVFGFIIILYIKNNETRYFALLVLVGLAGIVFICVKLMPNLFPNIISSTVNAFFIHTTDVNSQGTSPIHLEYLWTSIAYPCGLILGIFYFLTGSSILLKLKDKKRRLFAMYILSIVGCTLVFFVFIIRRYFQPRYMIFLLPVIFFITAVGYYGIYSVFTKLGKIIMNCILAIMVFSTCHYSFGYLYEQENNNAKFSEAYAELADYWGTENILPLYSYHYRSEYLQQFDEIAFQAYVENETDYLLEFAKKYPHGIVSIETQKFYMHSGKMKKFVSSYLKQIAGTGRDNNYVELYEYNFYETCKPEKQINYTDSLDDIIYYSVEQNDKKENVLYLKVDSKKIVDAALQRNIGLAEYDNIQMLAVKIYGEIQQHFCQLVFGQGQDYLYYEVPLGTDRYESLDENIWLDFGGDEYEIFSMEIQEK